MRERDEAEQSGSTAEFRASVDSSEVPEATQAWIVFACYVIMLIGRGHRRERDLSTAMRRLGDRDQLLARLRTTSSVLATVAAQLRAAAGDAAAATSEQSSAVA